MECIAMSDHPEWFASQLPAWLIEQLQNPRVTDICFNGNQGVFIDQGFGMERLHAEETDPFGSHALKDWVLAELSAVGKTWDARQPFIDAILKCGLRIHVIFAPLTQNGILVSLRRLPQKNPLMSASTDRAGRLERWISSPLYTVLAAAVKRGDSILISGATGSGKTTLTNDLLAEIPTQERVIALEDTPELAPDHPHFLSLISRPPNADGFGEVTLRTLLKQTLRMRPDRIVLGECRGSEVLELLQALNTGHHGALATLHANSAREAIKRIELLCLLAGKGSIPLRATREMLALGIRWIAQVKRVDSSRMIHELWKIEGHEEDTILMRQVVECPDHEY
jgi:pilus assembly protein CpaF